MKYEKSLRYKVGLFLFTLGHVVFVVSLVFPLLDLMSIPVAGLTLIIGELITLSSVIVLGKKGFNTIKKKCLFFFKKRYDVPVEKVRHYTGVVLLFLNIITTYVIAIYAWFAFTRPTPDNPIPMIWGLDFEAQGIMVLSLFLLGEMSFLLALYLLGGGWWERFKQLIIWEKR